MFLSASATRWAVARSHALNIALPSAPPDEKLFASSKTLVGEKDRPDTVIVRASHGSPV